MFIICIYVYRGEPSEKLNEFMLQCKILPPNQFGFIINHSTVLAIFEIYNQFLSLIDEGKRICSIFVDLSNVFVTVQHELVYCKNE